MAGYERATLALTDTRGPIDSGTIAELEAVLVVVSVILNLQSDPAWAAAPEPARQAVLAYHGAMADWFDRCAEWVRAGTNGRTLGADIPLPPALDGAQGDLARHLAARTAWYGVLDADLRAIMSQVGQSPMG